MSNAETGFCLGPRVFRAIHARPYERQAGDPLYRPLKIFTVDPSVSRLLGSETVSQVPFEPLGPGPNGRLFKVDCEDGVLGLRYTQANLDESFVLMQNGYKPSASNPQFHQQMVYAVCSSVYAVFRRALGRDLTWGFKEQNGARGFGQLLLRPHVGEQRNGLLRQSSRRAVLWLLPS